MPTIVVTANDTGVGKTWVTATLARLLLQKGECVEVVKAVETGVPDAHSGDATCVQSENDHAHNLTTRTLMTFTEPMAPVEAARRDGKILEFEQVVDALRALPDVPWRIIEGAGGIAVPLEAGERPRDFADLAKSTGAEYIVLVVEDRLGAINQARLLAEYANARKLRAAWWLNQASPDVPEAIRETNLKALKELHFPLLAAQGFRKKLPGFFEENWLK